MRFVDALQTIATLAVYGLCTGVTESGETYRLGDGRFNQAHVELIQAVSLQMPEQKTRRRPPHPHDIQQLFDMLPEIAQAFSLHRLALVDQNATNQQKAVAFLQEFLRGHTQNVRNWGYFRRVGGIVQRLCQPIDHYFGDQIGITATEIIKTFEYLVIRMERQLNARWRKHARIFSDDAIEKILRW